MKTSASIPTLLFALMVTGCSSMSIVDPVSDSAMPWTALTLDYELDAHDDMLKQSGCTMQLKAVDHGQDLSVHLDHGSDVRTYPVVPGIYKIRGIYCYRDRNFSEILSNQIQMVAESGRIAYLRLSLKEAPNRRLSIEVPQQDMDTIYLRPWYGKLNSRDRNRIAQGLKWTETL